MYKIRLLFYMKHSKFQSCRFIRQYVYMSFCWLKWFTPTYGVILKICDTPHAGNYLNYPIVPLHVGYLMNIWLPK